MLPRHKGIILLTENILNVTWWLVVSTPQGVGNLRGAGLESSHLSGWNSRSDMFEPPQDCCVYATMLLRPQGVKERLPFSLQVKPVKAKNHVQESTLENY